MSSVRTGIGMVKRVMSNPLGSYVQYVYPEIEDKGVSAWYVVAFFVINISMISLMSL
jgi:hypothetical protein